MIKALRKLGIEGKFLNIIKAIYVFFSSRLFSCYTVVGNLRYYPYSLAHGRIEGKCWGKRRYCCPFAGSFHDKKETHR
jgi:hypothetical protein